MNAIAPFPPLGKLIPLLGSDKDGEVIAAAKAINRTLKRSGRDFHDLAAAVEIGGRHIAKPERTAEPVSEMDMARFSLQFVSELTASEADFIRSVMRLLAYGNTLTPKQSRWLLAIFTALGGRA